MRPRFFALVLSTLSTMAAAGVASRPAAADAPVEDARAKARRLFNEGIDLRGEGKHLQALAKFREADALLTTPKTRLELGRELVLLGRYVEGAITLASVASVSFDPKDAAKYEPARKEATALAEDAEHRVSHIHLILGSDVRDLTVDGRSLLAKTGDVPVDPGRHDISATVHDVAWHRSIETEAGKTVNVEVVGARPVADASAKSGHGPPTLAVALLVGGGVGIVGGVALALSAKSTYADSEPNCGIGGDPDACNDEGLRQRHSAGTRSGIATGLLVIGAGLAVSGLVVWWVAPKDSGASTATAGLRIGPGSVSFDGRF
jgi:hypothetical protein